MFFVHKIWDKLRIYCLYEADTKCMRFESPVNPPIMLRMRTHLSCWGWELTYHVDDQSSPIMVRMTAHLSWWRWQPACRENEIPPVMRMTGHLSWGWRPTCHDEDENALVMMKMTSACYEDDIPPVMMRLRALWAHLSWWEWELCKPTCHGEDEGSVSPPVMYVLKMSNKPDYHIQSANTSDQQYINLIRHHQDGNLSYLVKCAISNIFFNLIWKWMI